MKVASLFAGIGGFDLALTRLGHEIVYVNEWDKYAVQTYEKNFKHKVDTRDITTVPADGIPDHDLLVGGFPCQAFSIAGKRRGFEETRGTLFFEIARILKDKKPRYFILENVKGLLSHDDGSTFKTIISSLDELGYDLQWQVLNSKNFGVPQNRERVFIIGHLRGIRRPQIFPITGGHTENIREDTISQVHPIFKKTERLSDAFRIRDTNGVSVTLKGLGGGLGAKTGLYAVPKTSYAIDANYYKGINTGSEGGKSSFEKMKRQTIGEIPKVRRLTPIECERLQGFPDNWTEGVSDTQRYKQLGNAVTVNVVEEIVRRAFN